MRDRTTFEDALRLHQHGKVEEAERAYQEILAVEPSHAGAMHLLGVIRQQQRRHGEAVELIGRAIELKPTVAVYHNNLGAALLSLGRFAEAEASFHRALAIRANYADALANLGMVKTGSGKEDAALESFRKALRLDPRHRDARTRLATLLGDLARHQQAVQLFEEALADQPTAETYADFGNLLLTMGRTVEAAAAYRTATELKPDYAAAHFNLANACQELHDTDAARSHFARAAELRPEKPLWRLRAEICRPAVF